MVEANKQRRKGKRKRKKRGENTHLNKESEGMKVCSTSWVSLGRIRDGCIEEAFSRSINESY